MSWRLVDPEVAALQKQVEAYQKALEATGHFPHIKAGCPICQKVQAALAAQPPEQEPHANS